MDDLTGLANLNEFYLQVERQIALSAGELSAGALLYIDADHFKAINDRYESAVGDKVLREIGQLLLTVISTGDFAARFGGAEFDVFLKDADFGRADWLAQKILIDVRKISQQLQIRNLEVTVSVGIAQFMSLGNHWSQLSLHQIRASIPPRTGDAIASFMQPAGK